MRIPIGKMAGGLSKFKGLFKKGIDYAKKAAVFYDRHRSKAKHIADAMRTIGGEKGKQMADAIDKGTKKADTVRRMTTLITG